MKSNCALALIVVLLFTIFITGCSSPQQKSSVGTSPTRINTTDKDIRNKDINDVNVKKNFRKWKKKLYSKDPNIQTAAAVSLLNLEYYAAFDFLINILNEARKKTMTIAVLKAFGFAGDDRALMQAMILLDNKDEKISFTAAETLGKLNSYKSIRLMTANLMDTERSDQSRILIAKALGDVRNKDSVEHLIDLLKSENEELQTAANSALVKITKQPIGKDVASWKEWWELNKLKSREEWLEDIVDTFEDNIKTVNRENEILDKKIARKSIELLKVHAKSGNSINLFLDAAKSKYPEVKIYAAKRLAKKQPPEAKDIFSELLLDENLNVRIIAAKALGSLADKSILSPLLDAINDENTEVQVAAIKALGRIEMPQAVEALKSLLNHNEIEIVKASVASLGQIGISKDIEKVIPLLTHKDPAVREEVTIALGKHKNDRYVAPLINALSDNTERVRWYAADSLGKQESKAAVLPLIRLLSDGSARVRESATTSLGVIGDKSAINHLTRMLDDTDIRVTKQASEALLVIAGDDPQALNRLSEIFFAKKNYDRAINVIEKQLVRYNENEEALWDSKKKMAKALALTENWEKASNLYTILIDHFTNDVNLKDELINCLLEMNQYEMALDHVSTWTDGNLNDTDFFWKSRLNIIATMFSNNDYEKVIELVNKFENEAPEMGGNDLKENFINYRDRSLVRKKEDNLEQQKQ